MEEINAGWAALAAVLVVLVTLLILGRKPERKLPPSPRAFPIIGHLPYLSDMPYLSLYELAKKHGPLMLLKFGSVNTLVITSGEYAEATLKTHDQIMASRPDMVVSKHVSYDYADIAWTPYGSHWRYVRKVATTGLLTANRLAQFKDIREREVMATLQFILEESKKGNPVDMTDMFLTIALNNITQMMMNRSFCSRRSASEPAPQTKETETSELFLKGLRETFILLGAFNLSDFFPLLKPFDPQGLKKRVKDLRAKMDVLLDEIIDEHRRRKLTNAGSEQKEDFIDALLGLVEAKELDTRMSKDTVIKAIASDMISGSGDTSTSISQWALTEMMKNPGVMKKVQEELDEVVGKHRLVQEDDLPKLKYFQAVVKEVMRLHPGGPFLVPHQSTQDCEIKGYFVPAKSTVLVNLWGMHRDPNVWQKPLEFNPDRFLNSTIDYKGQDYGYLPFGTGRRMCVGMNLGMLMVMYPVAVLIHAINFRLPEGQKPEDIDMSESFGLILFKRIPLSVFGDARLAEDIYPTQKV